MIDLLFLVELSQDLREPYFQFQEGWFLAETGFESLSFFFKSSYSEIIDLRLFVSRFLGFESDQR